MQSEEMIKNFNDEVFPDINITISKLLNEFNDFTNYNKYSFTDIYNYTKKNEYSLNRNFIKKYYEINLINNDVKGLYIFHEKDTPQYIGISKNIFKRIKQHFLGKNHYQASLAYLIAREKYDKAKGYYSKERNSFPFDNYRIDIQNNMINNWLITIIPETDNYKLYLKEIYLACKLKTYWNSFATH